MTAREVFWLAISYLYEVGLNLVDVTDPETISRALETILGLDYTTTLEKVSTPASSASSYLILSDFVSAAKADEIRQLMDSYARMADDPKYQQTNPTQLEWHHPDPPSAAKLP